MTELNQLMEYIRLREEILKLEKEFLYYSRLIKFAEENLPIDRLEEISRDLEIIARYRAFLSGQLSEMRTKLLEVAPGYVKLLQELKENARHLSSIIISLRQKRLHPLQAKVQLEEIVNQLHRKLLAFKGEIDEIKRIIVNLKGHARKIMEIDVARALRIYGILNNICKIFLLPEEEFVKLQNLIGFKVLTEENEKIGFINDICVSRRSFEIYIEIADERRLTEDEIVLIFNSVALEYGATSKEDFIRKLQEDAQRHLGCPPSDALKPSVIKEIFKIRSVSIPDSIRDILKPRYYVVGFYPIKNIEVRNKEKTVIIRSSRELVRVRTPIHLPSAIIPPRSLIGKKISDDEFKYMIVDTIWLPIYGWCFLTIRKDKNDEFAPCEKFLDALYREWNIVSDKPLRIPSNYEEKSWGIKALIVKSLRGKEKITMAEALRPRYVFSFCLLNGISFSYPQIFSAYLFLIPTCRVSFKEEEIRPKIPLNPISLFEANIFPLLEELLSLRKEIFGLLITRKDKKISIIVQLIDKISEAEIDTLFEDKIIADDIKQVWGGRTSNIISRLISLRLIKTPSEYYQWLHRFGLKEIEFHELLSKIYGDFRLALLCSL